MSGAGLNIIELFPDVFFLSMSEMAALWAQASQKSQDMHSQANNGSEQQWRAEGASLNTQLSQA